MKPALRPVVLALLLMVPAACDGGTNDNRTDAPEILNGRLLFVYGGVPDPRVEKPRVKTDQRLVTCGPTHRYCPGAHEPTPTRTYFYAFPAQPDLTDSAFELDETRQDFDANTGEPIVLLRFTEEGGEEFRQLTRRLAARGSLVHLAVVVDDELVAAPAFDPRDHPGGIDPDGGVQINGLASLREARELANDLRNTAWVSLPTVKN